MTEADVLQLKAKLKAEAAKKYPTDQDARNAYVFGTLRKLGWRPKSEDEGDHEYR